MTPSSGSGRRALLNFHGIGEPPPEVPSAEHPFWCPRQQWPGIADAIAAAVRDGSTVEITFDDGNASDVDEALPVLVERGLTASFYVCAGRIGQPGYLDEQGLLQLQAAGMGIGSHGWDHVDLRAVSDADLVHETRDSQVRLAEVCGVPVTDFAVPFGSYDRRVLRHLRHYATVYTSDSTSASPRAGWVVPRWSYVQGWTAGSVTDLAWLRESTRHRLRQRSAMLAKRWR